MDNNHSWYLVTVVLKITFARQNNRYQYQEQCRLVQAADEAAARNKAVEIVASEGAAVVSNLALGIHWQLDSIAAVIPLTDMWDGAEVYSKQLQPNYERNCVRNFERISA